MEHLMLMAAVAATTDQGLFTAVISIEAVAREKDIVSAAAMVDAMSAWNRPIPLRWNHSSKAEDVIGEIDPQSVQQAATEVRASGRVDLESRVGSEAWRSFKSGSVGFSYGYLIPEGGARKRAGGGRRIVQLDIFEVTATPTPMNNATRVLEVKSAEGDEPPYDRDLEAELERWGIVTKPALAEQYERAEPRSPA